MSTMHALNIRLLERISPSLAESLRMCPLQGGLSCIAESRAYVLGNPKAWLGTAYHEVLERMYRSASGNDNYDAVVQELWNRSIEKLRIRATRHPLDRRFSRPDRWPGYHLVRASAIVRARELLGRRESSSKLRVDSHITSTPPERETRLSAMNGKLVGKPDVILENEILDYKSGRVVEDAQDGEVIIREGYARQLRLYGHLVNQTMGERIRTGTLLPMHGKSISIPLVPAECRSEAEEAVAMLDTFNDTLHRVSNAAELATPSPQSCRWCQFKSICPAFWSSVNCEWAEYLGTAAVSGTLVRSAAAIHNGEATSLELVVEAGTADVGSSITIAPLKNSVHGCQSLSEGDDVRIINLYRRADGQFAPTNETVVTPESRCLDMAVNSGCNRDRGVSEE